MKIIAGKFGGRTLGFRTRKGLRVTSQKVKEAMFSIIGDAVDNSSVLDLYCGYGTLGIEAVSRGAQFVTFVDVDSQALKQLSYFLSMLGILEQTKTVKRDAVKVVKHSHENQFDIIIMDPPYHINYEKKTLEAIEKNKILKSGGICVVEHYSQNKIPDRIGTLVKFKEKKYGDTGLSIYRRHNPDDAALANIPIIVEEEESDEETSSDE